MNWHLVSFVYTPSVSCVRLQSPRCDPWYDKAVEDECMNLSFAEFWLFSAWLGVVEVFPSLPSHTSTWSPFLMTVLTPCCLALFAMTAFLVFHVEFRILQAEAVVLRLGNVYPTLFIFSSLCMCLTCYITLLPEKHLPLLQVKIAAFYFIFEDELVNRFSSPPTRNSPELVAFPRPYKTRLCKQRKSSLKWWAVLLVNGQTTMTLAHRMVEGFFFSVFPECLSCFLIMFSLSLPFLPSPPPPLSSLFTWNEGLWRQWPQYQMHAKMNGSVKWNTWTSLPL